MKDARSLAEISFTIPEGTPPPNVYVTLTDRQRTHSYQSNLILLSPPATARSATDYVVETFAGAYNLGDEGAATAASLNQPTAVMPDGRGNLYILDSRNFRIRKVNAAGVISTLAVIEDPEWMVLGFRPTDNYLTVMTIGPDGNLYVSGSALWRVTPQGEVKMIARLSPGHPGIAVGRDGAVFLADGYVVTRINLRVSHASMRGMAHSVTTAMADRRSWRTWPCLSASLSTVSEICILPTVFAIVSVKSRPPASSALSPEKASRGCRRPTDRPFAQH